MNMTGLIIALMLIGLVLIFVEIFLIPGIGVSGVLGILAMGGASYCAFYEYGTNAGLIVTSVNLALIIAMVIYALRAKTWKRLSLEAQIDSKAMGGEYKLVSVGDTGKAMTRLAPSGTIIVSGHKMEGRAFEGMIDAGADVEVVEIEEGKVYVKPIIVNS